MLIKECRDINNIMNTRFSGGGSTSGRGATIEHLIAHIATGEAEHIGCSDCHQ
jgi:hypothetical protein